MIELLDFYQQYRYKVLDQVVEHLGLTTISVLLACLISLPLGVLIAKNVKLSSPVLSITGILQTIPSIALLGFLIPVFGIGTLPAIFALFLYSLLPIVRNVFTGIIEIDPSIKESARGMGMNFWQILFKVELPLAMPTIFAGIRTATVINVGVATLAAYIAAGGLGEFIFGGIALNNSVMILAGALPAAILAIFLDYLLGLLQKSSLKKFKRNLGLLGIGCALLIGLSAFQFTKTTELKAGYPPEFIGRQDGLPALRSVYNLELSNMVIAPALMYKAIREEQVDLISGYSTDGRIRAYKLRVLTDDKHAFPPYEAAPLVNSTSLEKYPDLKSTLNLINGRINDSLMAWMNYQVDENKVPVRKVAQRFLENLKLYHPHDLPDIEPIRIGSKIFTEQYILTEIYKLLIESEMEVPVKTSKGLGGTKVVFEALKQEEIDLYPEYTGTALQVLLNMENKPGLSPSDIFEQVQARLQSEHNLTLLQPLGFNNTYALMMRQEQTEELNITSISDIPKYLEREN